MADAALLFLEKEELLSVLNDRLRNYSESRRDANKKGQTSSARKKSKKISWLKDAISKVGNNERIDVAQIPPILTRDPIEVNEM